MNFSSVLELIIALGGLAAFCWKLIDDLEKKIVKKIEVESNHLQKQINQLTITQQNDASEYKRFEVYQDENLDKIQGGFDELINELKEYIILVQFIERKIYHAEKLFEDIFEKLGLTMRKKDATTFEEWKASHSFKSIAPFRVRLNLTKLSAIIQK